MNFNKYHYLYLNMGNSHNANNNQLNNIFKHWSNFFENISKQITNIFIKNLTQTIFSNLLDNNTADNNSQIPNIFEFYNNHKQKYK